ncbi:MAG: UbiX family flavin prenyltransferase [Leptospiraceae bacterium]|nr:UbiX family flavin prenyltransferase [Leptospiraceae bacterium]
MKLVVAISGASGSIYAARFLKKLLEIQGETFLIFSPASIKIFKEEYQTKANTPEEIINFIIEKWKVENISNTFAFRNFHDIGEDIASGSNIWEAMVIVPCSMKTIGSIVTGITTNLIERCADVTLKEKRRLIAVPRETPYNQIHLKNMLKLDKVGGIILPASPGFYFLPNSLDDLGDFIAGRIFNLLGYDFDLFKPWNPKF